MCGITGFVSFAPRHDVYLKKTVLAMNDTLHHRGPDSDGHWLDPPNGLALGHRRLSIQDLSSAGRQPMVSDSGRYQMVFNGEIYNHLTLRKELAKGNWRGHSDTETILACIEQWGLQPALARFTGMFALALWDSQLQRLFLARDRLGEKPIYYGLHNGSFMFASELKALKPHPDFSAQIDRDSLGLYMRHCNVPAPYCIYQNTWKLMPGMLLSVDSSLNIEKVSYWSATDVIIQSRSDLFRGTAQQAVDELDQLLTQSVNRQIISDVPLGAFLSGGVDSTTIVALMQAHSSNPVKTFTIGFEDKAFNEAEHAKLVAKHLGTEHTELYVSSQDALNVIPSLHQIYDEPFADSSQIPTFLVSQMARQYVTVALSGDGGDELFSGYDRHSFSEQQWPTIRKLPLLARTPIAKGIKLLSPAQLDRLTSILPRSVGAKLSGDKLHKVANVISAHDDKALYNNILSQWHDPTSLVLESSERSTVWTENQLSDELSAPELMMALDMLSYLPDDILTKVDRAAMSVSLETRVPMLDHQLVEFAWRLPISIKLKDGVTKWPLRELLYRYVPKELIDRPKMGFSLPLDDWLRGPLKEWADSLLHPARLKDEGYLNEKLVSDIWLQHLSGKQNHTKKLWCVLMFQQWLENEQFDGRH
ncbi:asparagine synthase (glutamine-hydrolyzing) [Vibrio panuliri]|uniref:asparagine synthase (glutamine-hydrolyzing) n=1 Tax=Vibrio panuliri TaxID=1381081 RepID=A0ABX3FSJ4_9VIBR|nr:asparagine synthase (glutamine-hydrolyzing) [Vibrio panuliri]KAB1457625.1 asparagine synthase (glutamine-hydrolyzing) [Vibrio panuliri]OLQ95833.1 asparagine synthase (glutamine-hydrolyzing) [Vibrio panuliri]